jgi:hypothetical protein
MELIQIKERISTAAHSGNLKIGIASAASASGKAQKQSRHQSSVVRLPDPFIKGKKP